MLKEISELFERDIQRVIDELNAFKHEKNLWKVKGDIKNTSGNLALHINGNLNHFIGAQLGGTDYIRNRTAEFEDKSIPVNQIIDDLEKTSSMITKSLNNIEEDDLNQAFPITIFDGVSTLYFLIHLYGHLNYHLGQINYLRRELEY